jgi:hypothetical protein
VPGETRPSSVSKGLTEFKSLLNISANDTLSTSFLLRDRDPGAQKTKATTKARNFESTKKGKGVYETLFFRVFLIGLGFLGFPLISGD